MPSKERCTGSFSFIFSAEWDYVTKGSLNQYIQDRYSISLTQRLNLIRAVELLLNHHWVPYHCVEDITAQKEKWDDKAGFTANNDDTAIWLYREFMYFTGKVRPLVYNTCDYQRGNNQHFLQQLKTRRPASVILERTMGTEDNSKNRYLLLRKAKEGFILYSLPLASVQMRLYASGVMNISLCCNDELNAQNYTISKMTIEKKNDLDELPEDRWEKGTTVDDIAWIRDAGRRLFWPHGCGSNAIDSHPENAPIYSALQLGIETIELCDYRALEGLGEELVTKPEYFEWTRKLICGSCVTQMKLRGSLDAMPNQDLLVIQYFNDDRMYLHNTIISPTYDEKVKKGWIGRKEITNTNRDDKEEIKEAWQGMRAWYGILAADSDWDDSSCQDVDMLIQKCEEATDSRWVDCGTFYGLYYNAFTQLLAGDRGFLSRNMDWMYYQMFLLAIMQRSSIQRFYREASGAAMARSTRKANALSSALKEKYVLFMNRMWFTEVTEQEQGCDFFDKLQENMGLKRDMDLLKDAIEDLNALTNENLDDVVNNALLPATFIGLVLSAFDGLSNLFGVFDPKKSILGFASPFPTPLTIVSVGIGVFTWLYYRWKNR